MSNAQIYKVLHRPTQAVSYVKATTNSAAVNAVIGADYSADPISALEVVEAMGKGAVILDGTRPPAAPKAAADA